MAKTIALVGHCGPDSSFLRMAVGQAVKGATVISADDDEELERVISEGVDLLLFNRVLDYGFSTNTGAAVIKRLRAAHPDQRMMLVSNYPDAQAEAVAAGALPGFGKREIGSSRVIELLKSALE